MFRRVILIAGASVLLTASAAPPPRNDHAAITIEEYAPDMFLEHHHPPVLLPGAPVVVLVHGCCGDRRDLGTLARALARRGAVVMNADVQQLHAGGGWPASYRDVVCAVAEARVVARELPGGDHPVVLAGWSDGALLGATVTLGWRELPRTETRCSTPVGDQGPDRFIGIGGHYGWPPESLPDELVNALTIEWFGGTPAEVPLAWREGNPQWWLRSAARDAAPPFDLIAFRGDVAAAHFAAALTDRGTRATVYTVQAVRDEVNLALSQPRGDAGDQALRALCRILGLSQDPLIRT